MYDYLELSENATLWYAIWIPYALAALTNKNTIPKDFKLKLKIE